LLQDFGCNIGRRPAEGGRERLLPNDLSKTKVCELDIEILVNEQNVLRLDVTVDNVALMLENQSVCGLRSWCHVHIPDT
jgi:hypothetical protein